MDLGEGVIKKYSSSQEISVYENLYYDEMNSAQGVSKSTKLNYAQLLIKSSLVVDVNRGLNLIEELLTTDCSEDERAEYLYYAALANARKKEYSSSYKRCQEFLNKSTEEPHPLHGQTQELQEYVSWERTKEYLKNTAAFVGGFAVFAAGVGMALSKPSSNRNK